MKTGFQLKAGTSSLIARVTNKKQIDPEYDKQNGNSICGSILANIGRP